MRVISLWQPFASLIFSGMKTYETRPMRFPTKLLGESIGLHATAKFTPASLISPELDDLCVRLYGKDYRLTLPRSAILGTVRLAECHLTTDLVDHISHENRIAGDWSPGRYAWQLMDVKPWELVVPARGNQGWWAYEPTALTP